MSVVKCKKCNHEILYKPVANFIVFCPECMKYTYLECERGYGPVVPCHIYLGGEMIGIVIEIGHVYYLQMQDSDVKLRLEKLYFEALEEAIEIVESRLGCIRKVT